MIEYRRPAATLQFINPLGLYDPESNGYSHVAVAGAPARLVFVAGQGGETQDGQLSSDFGAQVRQALANLQTALQGAGAEFGDVVRVTVLVVDHSEARLRTVSAELRRAFGVPRLPACTLIPVPRLALDGMLFEIEATAVLSR